MGLIACLLHDRADERGNRSMDSSTAGYQGGGVRLRSPPVAAKLTPAKGDHTARIRAALDAANRAVLLGPGEYELAGTLTIARSGVVLRGSGAGDAVAWNVTSPFLLVQQPPGSMNWCIGCTGKAVKAGEPAKGIFGSPAAAQGGA